MSNTSVRSTSNKKHGIDLMEIVFAVICLWIINPMSVDFYNWNIFAGLAGIWCLLAFVRDKILITKLLGRYEMILYYFFILVLMIYNVAGHAKFYFQSITIPFVYIASQFHFNQDNCKYKNTAFRIAIIYMLIITIKTIIDLQTIPNMSRFLAGGSSAVASQYASPFRGGYSFIYTIMLFTITAFASLMIHRRQISRKWKFFEVCQVVLGCILVYKSQYTTALILLFAGCMTCILVFANKPWERIVAGIAVAAFAAIYFSGTLPSILIDISSFMPEGEMKAHFMELANVSSSEASSSVNSLTRVRNFNLALERFISSPLIGAGRSYNHNEIIDILAQYGLLGGIPYIASLVSMFKHTKQDITMINSNKIWSVGALSILALCFLNPVADGIFFLLMFWMVPKKLTLEREML